MAGGVGGGPPHRMCAASDSIRRPVPVQVRYFLTFLSLDAGKDSGAGRGLELSRVSEWLSDLTCWLVFLLFLKFSVLKN